MLTVDRVPGSLEEMTVTRDRQFHVLLVEGEWEWLLWHPTRLHEIVGKPS